jgi:hypothetical protein
LRQVEFAALHGVPPAVRVVAKPAAMHAVSYLDR